MIYLKLFWAFFQIGLFSIGGGYAALPLIQNQVVNIYGWLNMAEFADIITISQMTPGPIAINAATFVGTRICGALGAVVATLGCILPSCIIVLTLSILYAKYKKLKIVEGILSGLRPAVVGLIAAAGASILLLALWHGNDIGFNIDWAAVALIALGLIILRKTKASPIVLMICFGVIGGIVYNFA